MSKGTRFIGQLLVGTLLWLLALYHPGVAVPRQWEQIVPILPLYAIISFGAYSLASVGYSLFTFRDCPEAYESLMKEVAEAKADLRTKGLVLK